MGESHEVTATIKDGNGTPQEGIAVTFTVISGPNEGTTSDPPIDTDAEGKAVFEYDGTGGPGTDVIQACFDYEAQKVCSTTVTKVWNADIASTIDLTPEYELNLVGQDHTVTATISGDVVAGVSVSFTVISGPNAGKSGSGTTDINGHATYTYNGDGGVGTDQIQACFTSGETQVCSNVVQKEWTKEIIVLSPLWDENPAQEGLPHTVTATITTLKGAPVEGIEVTFTIKSGPNAPDSETVATNGSGQADFTYQGNGEVGTDVIRACFTNASEEEVCTDYGDTVDNDAIKEWGDACPAISVLPNVLPNAVIYRYYSQTFTGFGGEAPYTFEVTDGNLPQGLNLDSNSGVLSGMPTESGEFNFEITATDSTGGESECTGFREYTLKVCPGITVSPESGTLPGGTVGSFYSETISASGGTGPYTYELTAGSIPPGLGLSPGSIIISGIPTQAGTWHFTITAQDEGGLQCSLSQNYTITIYNGIPTLSEWGMIVLAAFLLGSVFVLTRKRERV